jgi:hypothetical protein
MAGQVSPEGRGKSRIRLIILVAVAVICLIALVVKKTSRMGTLVLEINEPNAEIWVDGNKMTTSDVHPAFDLPAGMHSLRVVKEGLQPVAQNVEVVAHERQIIRIDLDVANELQLPTATQLLHQ